jgi:DUF4097 and DUF4098 domain-containing protein YvlB
VKKLIALVVCGLVLFGSSVFVVGCVISHGGTYFGGVDMSAKATRTDTLPLTLAMGETLEITLATGDVKISAEAGGVSEITALLTAYGKRTEDAQTRLDAARVVVERTPGGARIHVEPEQKERTESGATVTFVPRADLTLRIPAGVKLDVHVSAGDIKTRGLIASSSLRSSYGDVHVAEAQGDLTLESSSGSVTLDALSGAKMLSARSSYGDVRAKHVEAERVSMHSSSGDVELEDAQCARAELDSQYGDLALARISGDVQAKTSSGDIAASVVRGKHAKLESGYGDVELREFTGTTVATSSSGSVTLADVHGVCEASSGYGEVKIDGVLTRVTASSRSGAVRVSARPGSNPDAEWSLESGYGDVSLTLPRDIGFELQAKTGYGELDIDMPLMVEAGALKDKHAIRGKVGDGGQRIALKTSSGDVHVGMQAR